LNTVYGARDRAELAALANRIDATAPTAGDAAGRVADALRRELPDMDDLAIGRVLVALTVRLQDLFHAVTSGEVDADVLRTALARAGLQLTEPEWKGLTP
jgi:hypothetical protein